MTAGSGNDNISTGDGDDRIQFLSANFDQNDTVDGGTGSNTIQITDDATVVDLDFDNVSNVQTLLLSGAGAQDVDLTGTIAQTAGIRTITATAGTASNIDISGTTAGIVVTTNAGNDTVTAGSGNDNISTGAGDDVLKVGTFSIIGTYNMGSGTNDVELGNGASTAGATLSATGGTYKFVLQTGALAVTVASDQLVTISGSQAATNIDAAGFDDTVTVDTTRGALTGYTLDADIKIWNIGTVGNGNNVVISGANAQSVTFGSGNDTIRFLSANFDENDTVAGGNGTDTIEITDDATVVDLDFDNVSSVETLLLSGTGAQNVTLAALHSDAAGIRTVTATAGTASTIDIGGTASGLTVTTNTGNDTVIAGFGADNISTGVDDDTIRFLSANFTSADTVSGGNGTDTIEITDAATVIDADFTNVTSVERLVLGNFTNSVTIGDLAAASGVATVVGGTGADTVILTDAVGGGTITSIRFESASGSSDVFNIGGLTVNGQLSVLSGADIIIATDGADISALNAGAVTTAEHLTLTGEITMTLVQHEALIIDAGTGNETTTAIDTVTLTTSGTFNGQGDVETYNLSDDTGNKFTQVAGNTSVKGGASNDIIITSSTDSVRGDLSINLVSGGGTDTVALKNATISGLGGAVSASVSNATTINDTIALWTNGGSTAGTDYAQVYNFDSGDGGDKVAYLNGANNAFVGTFAENVSLTGNDLRSLTVNSVIEISAQSFQVNDGTNLGAVATMLDSLNNVQDGNYYVVIYDGNSSTSNAWIYAARATEGDGFDFADVDGNTTSAYDTDSVELIGVLWSIGADTLTSQNFSSSINVI